MIRTAQSVREAHERLHQQGWDHKCQDYIQMEQKLAQQERDALKIAFLMACPISLACYYENGQN